MKDISRRAAIGSLVTGITASSITVSAQTSEPTAIAAPVFRGEHKPKPLPFDPAKLKGISEKLIKSHWENNYQGAVSALNEIEKRLGAMVKDKDAPGYVYADLKREELVRTGSMVLQKIISPTSAETANQAEKF